MPRYRFTGSDAPEGEESDFDSDSAAESAARERSSSAQVVVTVHRHSGHVEAWEYVTEVDERQ